MKNLIGRLKEQEILQMALDSDGAELIALFGRPRVGKTFLIRQFFKENLYFKLAGIKDGKLKDQLKRFTAALDKATGNTNLYKLPESWPDAFDQLSKVLSHKLAVGKCVIFLDEFPWLNSQKSGFLQAFDHWWNSWGDDQDNLIVIICGSAASWMVENIVNNTGGLHNRITRKIRLLPFNLKETKELLQSQNVQMNNYQITQIYMTMGGIPHYLKEIHKAESPEQAINRICFTKDGFLVEELKNLYYSLFEDPENHLAIISVLAENNVGLTRQDIIKKTKLPSGGTITKIFDELIESGFIAAWPPYNRKSKDIIYKLSDEFTHFYIKLMKNNHGSGAHIWETLSTSEQWKSWSGFAFERVCLKHLPQIKADLGIGHIYTEDATWHQRTSLGKGAQIDLLIDRKDFVINLCEIKFSKTPFTITKDYAAQLETKKSLFSTTTKTRKSLFTTFITTFGLTDNIYSKRLVQNSVTLDALFET